MLPIFFSALLAAQSPTQASAYFSKAALTQPLRGCGHQGRRPPILAFEAEWYAKIWIAADEPSLATNHVGPPLPIWRLTVIPTWTAPVTYRVSTQADGTLDFIAKRLSGQGGYNSGSLKEQVVRTLTPEEQRRFVREINLAQKEAACPADEGVVVLDGTKLVLESKVGDTYAVGQREWLTGEPMLALSDLLGGFTGWATRPGSSH